MALRDEWDEARRAEASGLPDGTRSTYMEWLMERMVMGQRVLARVLIDAVTEEPEGEVPDESEDEDGADPA